MSDTIIVHFGASRNYVMNSSKTLIRNDILGEIMVTGRSALIKYAGLERTVIRDDIQVGQKAPDFLIQKNDLSLSKTFKSGGAKPVKLFSGFIRVQTLC